MPAIKPPSYQDSHEGATLLAGRIHNDRAFAGLTPQQCFDWLHRFYLELDQVVAAHHVYKLYGGAQGFLLATNVVALDAEHAATMLACAQELMARAEHIRVPGGAPLELTVALDSGPLTSGLLGTTNHTFQASGGAQPGCGRGAGGVQSQVPFLVADGTRRALPPAAVSGLIPLGNVQLRCRPEALPVWTLPEFNGLPLNDSVPPSPALPMPLRTQAVLTPESPECTVTA